ncbi:MAG: DUF1868 domain-containing protein [Anaerolineae bacterium]|nr:DUF1868 domain-containing protein [Anaerolineae bacterium]
MSHIEYAPAVGSKFYEDGRVRQFPGNTVICMVNPQSETYAHCAWIQEQMRSLPFAHKFALLPMPSMHMTVFEFITDDTRLPERWSAHLPLDTSLIATDDYFIRTFAQVPQPDRFEMAYGTLNSGEVGVSIHVQPADEGNAQRIRMYRDALSEATGVRFPDHDRYQFHISLAYHIIKQTPEESEQFAALIRRVDASMQKDFGIFQTDQPQIAFFDDMFDFVPVEKRHLLRSRQNI